MGNDASRLVQIAITLLAARYKNAIPNNFSLIKKVASLDLNAASFKSCLEHLSSLNFLEIQQVEQAASKPLAECYLRGEERREDLEEKRSDKDMSRKRDDAVEVFEHWKATWNHPKSALDPKRTAAIKRALKGYSVADLCASISGYQNSPHHTGQNERQTVYDDIELFLRDSSHIDAGLRFAQNDQPLTSELANHNVRVLKDWKPPELRDETARHEQIPSDDGSPSGGVRKAAIAASH